MNDGRTGIPDLRDVSLAELTADADGAVNRLVTHVLGETETTGTAVFNSAI